MDKLIGLAMALLLVGIGAVYWATVKIDNRVPSDWNIQEVQVNGRDCIIIHEYSQVGITCDWSTLL